MSHASPSISRTDLPTTLATYWLGLALASSACGGNSSPMEALPNANSAAGTTAPASTPSMPSGASGAPATPAATSGSGADAGRAAVSGAAGAPAAGHAAPAPSAGSSSTPVAGGAGAGMPAAGSGEAGSSAPAGGAGGATSTGGAQALAPPLDDKQTLIPHSGWTCGMPEGIPGPATGQPVFDIDFTVGDVHDLGQTQYGQRLQIDVKGGSVKGSKLTAELMDRGLDYQLTRDNGVVEIEQIHILQAGSSSVYMRNCGIAAGPGDQRVVLDFEAPNGTSVAWLNTSKLIGVRSFDPAQKTLRMKVYEVTAAADTANVVRVAEPTEPKQNWECVKASGSQGDVVYQESVGIGAGSVAVGASKRGNRNIIPITGGSTTGKIAGGVLAGGADFQLIGSEFVLDARYTLKTSEGELIIVRNCGPVGGLVPVFEARKDGKFAWLNTTEYLSSDPGVTAGAVNLTIYEKH
jgi:hypothetical protein